MKIRHFGVSAIVAALLAVSGSGVLAASVSEVQGRSSNSIAGSTLRVQSKANVDVAVVEGRGHFAAHAEAKPLPVIVGHAGSEFGRA